jgi:hypothetical protein
MTHSFDRLGYAHRRWNDRPSAGGFAVPTGALGEDGGGGAQRRRLVRVAMVSTLIPGAGVG